MTEPVNQRSIDPEHKVTADLQAILLDISLIAPSEKACPQGTK
jgi:hypothetical protein